MQAVINLSKKYQAEGYTHRGPEENTILIPLWGIDKQKVKWCSVPKIDANALKITNKFEN